MTTKSLKSANGDDLRNPAYFKRGERKTCAWCLQKAAHTPAEHAQSLKDRTKLPATGVGK